MSQVVYRLIAVALCIAASAAAPQTVKDDTGITYVRAQPDIQNQTITNNSSRESRIQNIPLTIPNIDQNTNQSDSKLNYSVGSNYPDKNTKIDPVNKTQDTTNSSKGKSDDLINISYPDKVVFNNEPRSNDNLPDPVVKQPNKTEIITAESKLTEIISDSLIDVNQTDHLALESRQFDSRLSDTTSSYEEAVTNDEVLEEVTVNTAVDVETTKAPPVELTPKLSHYGKSTSKSHSINLIGRSGERRFRSKCKCVKIWNCTKLQITVPRCPEEFFLCCS